MKMRASHTAIPEATGLKEPERARSRCSKGTVELSRAVTGTVLPRTGLRWWRVGRALALSAPQILGPPFSRPGPSFYVGQRFSEQI
jgi:hypothetical protein